MSQQLRWLAALIIGMFVFIIDLISKQWAHGHIPLMNYSHHGSYPYGGIAVFKDFFGIEFSIIHATNTGAAYGLFNSFQFPLLIVRIILIIGMLIYLFFYNKHRSFIIPLTLIITGALCNVIDYFIFGHVVDMFHFVIWGYDCPIFNIADSAITLGIIWLFYLSFKHAPSHD